MGTKVGSGLPWEQGPRPWTLSPDHRLLASQGLLSSWLPGGPGWAEEGGGSGRRPCQAPRGRASAEMRELKASLRLQLHHPGFLGMLPGPPRFKEPQGCDKHDLRTGLSMTQVIAELDAGLEASGVPGRHGGY